MKLDDKRLLAVLAERGERITSLERMADRACALIATELEPFEKYCGKVTVTFQSGSKTTITAAWRYRLPCGTRLAIKAKLELDDYGWTIRSKHFRSLSQSIRPLTSDSLAAAFLKVNGTVAEQAFEAIVREKPGQICSLLS